MTSRRTRRRALGVLAATLAAWPAQASPLLYERTLMLAADARCGLFEAGAAAALAAGQAQARREALRAGASAAELATLEIRARQAAADKACDGREIRAAAARVRAAHERYARVERMTYPGEIGAWRADRGSSARPRWRLAQSAQAGERPMVFGLAGGDAGEALTAVAAFPKGRTPYAARLVMRDAQRSPRPYLDGRGLPAGAVLPLARRLPPAGALKSYPAAWRGPAAKSLIPKGARRAVAFRFPADAAAALAGLDAREAVAVEFLFTGETVRVPLEVGDFAAGRDFLRLAGR
jgi:hypothetical protein